MFVRRIQAGLSHYHSRHCPWPCARPHALNLSLMSVAESCLPERDSKSIAANA
ncbi:unnamed protein product [Chondrus crispus]|uniref:Uncharacterized protein n=1 Tax=Chondrus crispus TaxID=2769 RepID=R7Q5U7_CHOCR|nr:unnamed protein product [Chondrus crispus]CDF33389.1 unnamed protein product [Chondrus crispus]|eukprot:XP_005713192.1 unnamed protein product [Chondrus crispus]